MATTTPTKSVESGGDQRHLLLRALQHVCVIALLASFQVVYALFIVVVSEVLAPIEDEIPLWFDILVETGTGIPVLVVLGLTAHYVATSIAGEGDTEWWQTGFYAAGVGAVVLPVFNYLMPRVAGAI